mmetsp:Transcript_67435/g.140907  ORF Transcript_67435/g.140907 Transcript_67435/m.140907 type:complete len:194 (-) Transcript_67435:407-988(-)
MSVEKQVVADQMRSGSDSKPDVAGHVVGAADNSHAVGPKGFGGSSDGSADAAVGAARKAQNQGTAAASLPLHPHPWCHRLRKTPVAVRQPQEFPHERVGKSWESPCRPLSQLGSWDFPRVVRTSDLLGSGDSLRVGRTSGRLGSGNFPRGASRGMQAVGGDLELAEERRLENEGGADVAAAVGGGCAGAAEAG